MTVYNFMYRCDGGQKVPTNTIFSSKGTLGQCERCHKYFMLYTNGKVVMHKRKSTRLTSENV